MGIQTIVDNATFLTVDKRKVASQIITRSGRIKTAEVTSGNPYRFTVGMHEALIYDDNRGLLEDLDTLDITTEEQIDIGSNNSSLSYITSYQGDMDGGSLSCVGHSGKNLYINASSATATTGNVLFKKGDFLQPVGNTGGYRYPYQVTSDVNGIGVGQSNVTVPVHRTVIEQDGVALTSGNVQKGSDVQWYVKMTQKPTYSIVPHRRIAFNNDFELIEVIE